MLGRVIPHCVGLELNILCKFREYELLEGSIVGKGR